MGTIRARFVAAGIAVALLSGCGAEEAPEPAVSPGSNGAGDPGAFPVTISGALGETTIDDAPERVVTLGWGASDIAVSLGVIPVGIEIDTWGGDAEGYTPWFREAVEDAGAELPETVAMYPELDIDAVVALEPDLVLAPQSGLSQEVFDQLSTFTDVVAHPDQPWVTPWRDQIEIAGQALGQPEEAAELVAGVEQQFADAAAEHPELAEVDFGYVYGGDPGSLLAYVNGDPRVDFLTELGLSLAPGVADLEVTEGTFTAALGLENANVLDDADLLFTWFNDAAEQEATEAQPLYAQIPAVQRGSDVVMLDKPLTMATTITSPLSVPWALDAYVEEILTAAANVSTPR